MAFLESSDFEWFLPAPKEPQLTITIPNEYCLNLNSNLKRMISEPIRIGIARDGKRIRIEYSPENGYIIPKSGSLKDKKIIEAIKKRGVKFPACYEVKKESDFWDAVLINRNQQPIKPKIPINPRKTGLEKMIQDSLN